jgi:hypothetical protein
MARQAFCSRLLSTLENRLRVNCKDVCGIACHEYFFAPDFIRRIDGYVPFVHLKDIALRSCTASYWTMAAVCVVEPFRVIIGDFRERWLQLQGPGSFRLATSP